MMGKTIMFLGFIVFVFALTGCVHVYKHFEEGNQYLASQQYEMAIKEYETALQKYDNPVPRFAILHNIGLAYDKIGDTDKARDYFHQSIQILPERGYYGYGSLKSMYYRQGKLHEAYEFALKAQELVNSPRYYELEKYSLYNKDLVRHDANGAVEFLELRLAFQELKNAFEFKNYDQCTTLAEKILSRKYHVVFGADCFGNTITEIVEGSIADFNGFISGDQILAVEKITISEAREPSTPNIASAERRLEAMHALDDLYDKYGSVINIKVKRKGRIITIACKLIYPEIEQTEFILQEAKTKLAEGYEIAKRDVQPPFIKILQPKNTRGIGIMTRQKIDFIILASDNVAVKKVAVNDIVCSSSQASTLEKTFLPGEVGKYTASVSPKRGKNIFNVTAEDINGNISNQQIEFVSEEKAIPDVENLYDHKIAVVIGINRYETFPPLEFAVDDAFAVRDKLSQLEFDRIIEVYDKQATRSGIARILGDELPALMGKNDALLVYFAGHGLTEELPDGSKEGYIAPVDTEKNNYRGSAISMSYIHSMIKKYKAKHILLVFDSCYSGLGLKRGGTVQKTSGFIKTMAQKTSSQIITAGGKDEQASEEKGHGVFTKAFLDYISDKSLNMDGFILASDVGQAIRKKVTEKTQGEQNPQYGWLSGEGDFIFEIYGN